MSALTESKHPGEFLLSQSPESISRDTVTVTVPGSTTLAAGTVLGRISSTGVYAEYDSAESDGRGDAAGVLLYPLVNDGVAPANLAGVIVNWGAEVRKAGLVWKGGVDQDAAYADLRALGVKARD